LKYKGLAFTNKNLQLHAKPNIRHILISKTS